ncbi:MAG TPA: hypothetical protein VNM92_15900 [Thermoanaerobaculia bacterium]|nr:hypothetical protein [Thermoanaerobaculia bacterium]
MEQSVKRLEAELALKSDAAALRRLQRGLSQVARFWRPEDGDAVAFEAFVRTQFISDQATLDTVFKRLDSSFEQLDGHMHEINREFRNQSDLDRGPILPVDDILAGYDPSAHTTDDFFENKLAFIVLLNFPLTTLDERLAQGETWSRRQWAEARLGSRFNRRVPAEVNLAISAAGSQAERYISEYNIWMHHLLGANGNRLFPEKLRLLSHWNLRDQIKADYSEGAAGLARQRMIQKVMDRIVTQSIPQSVIDNPAVDWNPETNEVRRSPVKDYEPASARSLDPSNAPEPDTRYATLLKSFHAYRRVDPYSPTAPTVIDRRFAEDRELPEQRVRAMLEAVLSSPLVPEVASLIKQRVGRPLEPFDIWYNGFRARGAYTEAQLDELVARKYGDAEAFKKDIPRLLTQLGFSAERAGVLARNIVVDPARGSGHAMGAEMRSEKAHLRTRFEAGGMNYKGYNIAIHEMGHNVEQTISLNDIDYGFLQGVPNTAFTEALAFVFQGHDLELLGLSKPDAASKATNTLSDFWGTFEIAGVALVDMDVWHWMYGHPEATPAQLREAVGRIAKSTWNKYYATIFRQRDVAILGVYSHMINYPLYLPDYPVGRMIAFQIEEKMEKSGSIGAEFERMARQGNLAPDVWMKRATGAPVGPEALLRATRDALRIVTK